MERPPFHNPNSEPLPDANDVESEFQGYQEHSYQDYQGGDLSDEARSRLESDKRWLRNLMIGLIAIGLVVGGLLSVGLIWGMNQLDMINPPTLNQDSP